LRKSLAGSTRGHGRCMGFAEGTMPRPYSTDLRERALLACEAGRWKVEGIYE